MTNRPLQGAKQDAAEHAVGYGLIIMLITMALLIAMHSQALASALGDFIQRVHDCLSAVACR